MNIKGCSISIVGYKHTKSSKIFVIKRYGEIEISRVEYQPLKIV